MKVVVDHISGSRRGQRQEFAATTRLSFGRHPDNEVLFDAYRDLDASSRHAELRRDGRGFVLEDVGSSNGTFCEGKKITELRFNSGDSAVVEFGEGGPKLLIWVGREGDVPEPPPPPPPRTPRVPAPVGNPWADARAASSGRGALAPLLALRSLVGHLIFRASWRSRILALLVLAAIVAVLALSALRGGAPADTGHDPQSDATCHPHEVESVQT